MLVALSRMCAYHRQLRASGRAVWKVSENTHACALFKFIFTRHAADRRVWNWHEDYFDEDNCSFEYLYLKDAFDALQLNAYCEEDGGHNVGWTLGHYDDTSLEDVTDPNAVYTPMIPPVRQTYTVDGKVYKVCLPHPALFSQY